MKGELGLNKSTLSLVAIVGVGLLVIVLTFSIRYPMNIGHFFAIWVFCGIAAGFAYLTTVRFHSPLCLTETEVFTTFDSRAEVVYDTGWESHLGIVFVNGYNAAKKYLSKQDISTSKTTTLLVTSSPFMVESVANGRYLVIRGTPRLLSRREAQRFLDRPSIKAAIGEEVRSADVYFVFASKTLHADEPPKDFSTLGDLAATLQTWHGEIVSSGEIFGEEFLRDLKAIRAFRESPLERMAKEKSWKQQEGEEKTDDRPG